MKRQISGFHRDDEGHWVAQLSCGHTQHMRHNPPFVERPWVLSQAGRDAHIGTVIDCSDCDDAASVDIPNNDKAAKFSF